MNNGNGIRLHLLIPSESVMSFLQGRLIRAWPIVPTPDLKLFPYGLTPIRIDPDKVEVIGFTRGIFTIQKKGAQKRPAGKKPGQRLHHSRTSLSP